MPLGKTFWSPCFGMLTDRFGVGWMISVNEDSQPAAPQPDQSRELVLQRVINVPREKLYRAWTEPELIKQWFAPKPWTTPRVEKIGRAHV